VLLWNTRGELTETTVANIALRRKGRWFTPPLASGLLPGVFRDRLLRTGRIAERILTRDDLRTAEGIVLFNSLRGWIPAELTESVASHRNPNLNPNRNLLPQRRL
jgi:para-aminobenzoate synthetase/4-amino-4-deoxychorismate lyase